MTYKEITPLTEVMKGKMTYKDPNHFLYQAVNILFSVVKLGILTCGGVGGGGGGGGLVYGTDSLLEPASSGQSMNYSLRHFQFGFKRETEGCRLIYTRLLFCTNARFFLYILYAKSCKLFERMI